MLDIFNYFFNIIFKILFVPFNKLHPAWGMLVISFVTGIVMLFVYKATSDQAGIRKTKNLVKGHFLAIRLYRDDIGLMFNTMKNIIVSNFLYMKKSFRPMLFLMIPVGIILIQLGTRYEFRPFKIGEVIIVSLRLDNKIKDMNLKNVTLELPDGLISDMPPVRIERLREINWRIIAEKPGLYDLVFKYNNNRVYKRLKVIDTLTPIAKEIAQNNISINLMNPGESSLPGSAFASIVSIGYPKREFNFLGYQIHWLIAFFVFSLIAAFAFKGLLGVEV